MQHWNFAGLITRFEAEKLLLDQSYGTYLVRLSEKIWGYAISYRAMDKCKHYLVNALPNYHFVGNSQMDHNSLGKSFKFYKIIILRFQIEKVNIFFLSL